MMFNITSCILVFLIAAIFFALVHVFLLERFIDDKKMESTFMKITTWGTLVVFMWVMSWQNWWR